MIPSITTSVAMDMTLVYNSSILFIAPTAEYLYDSQ